MLISVDLGQELLDIKEIEDLKSLAVQVTSAEKGTDRASLARILAPLGRLDETHAWLSTERLRAACNRLDDAWLRDFDAMLAYAESKGWVDKLANEVRVHVEFFPSND